MGDLARPLRRIFIERMSARPEGISLRRIGKLVNALRDQIASLYQ